MPVVTLEQNVLAEKQKAKGTKQLPTIIQWRGTNMIRQESFLAACQEVIDWAEEIDVTRVGIVGDMHSGKTTMAGAISHVIHANSKLPWAVKIFYEKQLMNFEATLGELTTDTNWILRFDDVSFLDAKHSKKEMNMVKEAVTKIRHLKGGKDVKIILIYNYHYSKGLDKYLRQADFRFFTTVGSEEETNMEDIAGTKMSGLIKFFAKTRQNGVTKKLFMSPRILNSTEDRKKAGRQKRFFYKWRNPFIPVLFYNNNSMRMIVSPTREFIQPICSVCANAEHTVESQVNLDDFRKYFEDKFSPSTAKGVVKQFLREQGLNTYSKKTVQARRFLDRAMETKEVNLEDLAISYGLTKPTRTVLRKKLPPEFTEDADEVQ